MWRNRTNPLIWTKPMLKRLKVMYYEEKKTILEISACFETSPQTIRDVKANNNLPERQSLWGRKDPVYGRRRENENTFEDLPEKYLKLWRLINTSHWGKGTIK